MATAQVSSEYAFPKYGVSLNFLLEVYCRDGDGSFDNMPISTLYKSLMEETKSTKNSKVEHWRATLAPEKRSKAIARPEYYIIHCWSYRLKEDLLECLRSYRDQIGAEDLLVYIDVFCLNLHSLQRQLRVYPWWDDQFFRDLERFEECVLCWPDWPRAQPLTRTWCAWELYAASVAGVPLGVALTATDKLNLSDTLIDNFSSLVRALRDFDARATDSQDRRMKKRTFAAVEKHEENFSYFNEVAVSAVRVWWSMQAFEKLPDLIQDYTQRNVTDSAAVSKLLSFINALSYLTKMSGDLEKARDICQLSVNFSSTKEKYLEDYPKDRARDLNNLSVLLSELGDYVGAIQNGESSIAVMKDIALAKMEKLSPEAARLGGSQNRNNIDEIERLKKDIKGLKSYIATGLNNMANLYFQLEMYELAADRYQESVELKIEIYSHAPDHPLVSAGLNNLGLAYQHLGDFVAAERVYRQALQARVRMLGIDAIEVAQTRYNLAEILALNAEHLRNNIDLYREAKKEAKLALDIAMKKLDADHEATVAYKQLYDKISATLGAQGY